MRSKEAPPAIVPSVFVIWVLLFEPHKATVWSQGATTRGDPAPSLAGICESVVAVHGYPCKEFQVTTADGYILSIQRIPQGRGGGGGDAGKMRQPVLLQHGVLMMLRWLGMAEFNPKGVVVTKFLKSLCSKPGIDCFDLMSSYTGKNCCLNASSVDQFLKFEPQPTSTKNMVHLGQTVRDGIVTKFDYGKNDVNMRHYGQSNPPIYNMSNIPHDLPLFLSYGGQDVLSDAREVELLLDGLKFHNGDKLTVQFIKDYAHADFVMGVSAKRLVYDAIVAFFDRQ